MHFYRRRTTRRNRKNPIRPILLTKLESACPTQDVIASLGEYRHSIKSQDVSVHIPPLAARAGGQKRAEIGNEDFEYTHLIRNTPTALLLDKLILKRRPRRQRHGDEPPRIPALVTDRRERHRACRIPAAELGDGAGEKDRLAERCAFGDVEGDGYGGHCGAGR